MKYKVTNISKKGLNGRTFHRIQCDETFTLIDGSIIHNGDYGGWIEYDTNLSQEGKCWVMNNAMAVGFSKVSDNAIVSYFARVDDEAKVYGNAVIGGYVTITGQAQAYGEAIINGNVMLYHKAQVYDKAICDGRCTIRNNAKVYNNAIVKETSIIDGDSEVYGNALVQGNAMISFYAKVYGNSIVGVSDGRTVKLGHRVKYTPYNRFGHSIIMSDCYDYYFVQYNDGFITGKLHE